mmetsp:Transcript_7867/g.22106  ORF Transcript_7867/g.22106 Transcript_7867/m.22106 type:complete len:201 (-) Transcript_7867:175-777(-)
MRSMPTRIATEVMNQSMKQKEIVKMLRGKATDIPLTKIISKNTTESCWWASDSAHNRRYEAVCDTVPSTYSIVRITWWIQISPMSNSSSVPSPSAPMMHSSSPMDDWCPPLLPRPPRPLDTCLPLAWRDRFISAWCCLYRRYGFGTSMKGTVRIAVAMSICGTLLPNIGLGSSVHMAMLIIELMMLGGLSIALTHLYTIR